MKRTLDTHPGRARLGQYLALALVGLALCAFVEWRGRVDLHLLDMTSFVEAAWRLQSAQVPYRDFLCPFPPLSLYMPYWAEVAFGHRLLAHVHSAAVLVFLHVIVLGACLRRLLPPGLVLLSAGVLASTSGFIFAGWTWYNAMAIAFVQVCYCATSAAWREEGQWGRVGWAAVGGIAAGLALATQQPFGLAAVVVALGVLLVAPGLPRHRCFAALSFGVMAILPLAFLTLVGGYGLGDLWFNVVTMPAGELQRFASLSRWRAFFVPPEGVAPHTAVALAAAIFFLTRRARGLGRAARMQVVVYAALAVVGGLLWISTSEHHAWSYGLLALVAVSLLANRDEIPTLRGASHWLVALMILMSANHLGAGYARTRLFSQDYIRVTSDYRPHSRYLEGFKTSKLMGERVDQIVDFCEAIPPTDRVAFFWGLGFLYGATARPAPVGVPLWWYEHGAGTDRVRKQIEDALFAFDPDWLILYKGVGETTGKVGVGGLGGFLSSYELAGDRPGFQVMRHKDPRSR